ncbi:glycoside hydrolase family protein [Campylobacter vicugnae]|uniref:glycoside hydrolase family protein n=1 Tax=Campylobacter vicugnae TaxID=1660076 RepID=UPI000A34476B|nr:hypothetical protein [Campylobacter sp. RM8966]
MSLIESIKVNEGFRANIYQCTAGVDTIGYGFNVNYLEEDELALNNGVVEPMSRKVADKILELKLEKLKAALIREFSWVEQKPVIVQEALLEMAYQLGIPKMKSFSQTLTYIKESNYQQAAINLRKSKWAQQTPRRVENLIRSLQNA